MTAAGVLPASGTPVLLREPTGEDELLVLQSIGPASATALALATRLLSNAGQPIDWPALPAVDLGAAALLIRRDWLGDTIRAEALCPARDCDEAIDVPVSIQAYLEHHRPSRFRGLTECEPGWFTLVGTDVRFRIPTVADVIGALDPQGAKSGLLEHCIRPASPSTSQLRRIDRALEALAPRVDGELSGTCPACGQRIELRFEPISYVLEELRDACTDLFSHIHELALAYHWSEQSILVLDRRRRHGYVTMIRGELALA